MHSSSRVTRVLVAVVAAAALVVAACGSSSNKSSGSSTASPSSTATGGAAAKAATGAPILIYTPQVEDNPVSNLPDITWGVKGAVAAINKSGGVNGRPIQVFYCNNRNDPNRVVQCNREAIQKKVVAMVGGRSCADAGGNYDQMLNAGIACIGGTGQQQDFELKNQFPLNGGVSTAYASLPFALKAMGAKKVAIGVFGAVAQSALVKAIQESAKKAGLPDPPLIIYPPQPSTDYSPFAQKLKSLGADAMIGYLFDYQTSGTLKALNDIGYQAKIANSNGTYGPNEVKALGGLGSNLVLGSGLPPSGSPQLKAFDADLDAIGAPKQYRRGFGPEAWLAVYGFKAVAEGMKGPITSQSVLDTLTSWPKDKPIDVQGLVKWAPSSNGPWTLLPRLTDPNGYILKVDNGNISLDKQLNLFQSLGLPAS